jgi:hypothetical protein
MSSLSHNEHHSRVIQYKAKELVTENRFGGDSNRVYAVEHFQQLPQLANFTAVTQSTNMTTTTVSNSKHTVITTASTSSDVAASQWIEFTFTNGMIAGTSTIVTVSCLDSGSDTAIEEKLTFQVNTIAAGSCIIRCVNASASAATAQIYKLYVVVDPHLVGNQNLALSGTSAVETSLAYATTQSGIVLTSAGADDDQIIIEPRTAANSEMGLNSAPTMWSGTKWGTENQVIWECAFFSGASVADVSFWAGLKLTNVGVVATDANQAYFLYSEEDDNDLATLTTTANLHFIYSVGDSDYITDLGIAVLASTLYRLRIEIDVNRQASVYVNEVLYGLNITTTLATQSDTGIKSLALTNDVDLIPYVGLQAHAGAAKTLTLCYEKISRLLFE